jgi:L-fucose isomerase
MTGMVKTDVMPKIGLLCISLDGERIDYAQKFEEKAREELKKLKIEILNAPGIKLDRHSVADASKKLEAENADAVIYLIGTWILADGVVSAVQQATLPIAIWGVPEPVSFSSVGANVVHGALVEMGMTHRLFYGRPEDTQTLQEISIYCKAAMAKNRLKKARFGLIGGRAISAYTTAADPNQIKGLFGVEIEHIDQMIVLEKARSITDASAAEYFALRRERYKSFDIPDDVLLKSVKTAIAVEQVIDEYELDMASIKCLGEFINLYTSCCMSVVFASDAGFTMSCQGDVNATLSMYIIRLLSGEPAFYGDISTVMYSNGEVRMINCGALPTGLAQDTKNIPWVTQYEYMGKGRGSCPVFCMKAGDVTFGYIGRVKGEYQMLIAGGTAFEKSIDEIVSVRTWPQGFATLQGDPRKFYYNLLSNHCVMGYGSLEEELKEFCDLYGIKKIVI